MVFSAVQVAKIHILKNLRSPRTLFALMLLVIILDYYLAGLRDMCAAVGYKVSVWEALVLIFNGQDSRCILFILFALFLCDLPGRDGAEPYVYQRCGGGRWLAGKMIAAALWGCLFVVVAALGCAIVLNRYASLSLEWGKVIKTLTKTDAAAIFQVRLPISAKIIGLYTAGQAAHYTVLLNTLTCAMLAMWTLALNAWSRGAVGNLLVVALAILSNEIGGMVISLAFLKLSPCSWGSLQVIGDGTITFRPTLAFAVTATTSCLAAAIALLCATRKKIAIYSAS